LLLRNIEEAVEERLRRPIDIGRRPRPKLTIARDIRDDAVAQADIDIRFDERLVPDRLVGPVGPKLRFWSSWRTRRERAGCC
jgi:hypothetical protein